jgi:hypothetical protein
MDCASTLGIGNCWPGWDLASVVFLGRQVCRGSGTRCGKATYHNALQCNVISHCAGRPITYFMHCCKSRNVQLLDGLWRWNARQPSRFATSLRQSAPGSRWRSRSTGKRWWIRTQGQAQQFIGEFAHRVSPPWRSRLYCAVVPGAR